MAPALTDRRRVAATGLHLPVLGLGTAHLGELYAAVPEDQAQATLRAAWDGGLRYFDTAPWYGRGLAEHRLGGFLRTCPRAAFQVVTKVGRTLHRPPDPARFDRSPWAGGLNFAVAFDYSRDGILRSWDQALQRLALPRVDALVIHDLDAENLGGADRLLLHERQLIDRGGLAALQELKAAGDIQAFGIGLNTDRAMRAAAARLDLDFALVALPYTLLDHATLPTGMAEFRRRGVSVVIGAPYASGILARGSGAGAPYAYGAAPEDVQARVRRIEAVAAAHAVPLPAIALQFVLAHPAVVSVIPGAVHPEEVRANIAHLERPLPAALWSDLKAERLIHPDAPTP